MFHVSISLIYIFFVTVNDQSTKWQQINTPQIRIKAHYKYINGVSSLQRVIWFASCLLSLHFSIF